MLLFFGLIFFRWLPPGDFSAVAPLVINLLKNAKHKISIDAFLQKVIDGQLSKV